jgi:hypothetical protein
VLSYVGQDQLVVKECSLIQARFAESATTYLVMMASAPYSSPRQNRRRFQAHEVGFLDGHMRLRDRELYINSQCHGAAEVGRDTGQAVPSLRNYEGGEEKFQRIAQQGK